MICATMCLTKRLLEIPLFQDIFLIAVNSLFELCYFLYLVIKTVPT